jgi:hypothetical protein
MVCRLLGYITNGDNGIQVVQQLQRRNMNDLSMPTRSFFASAIFVLTSHQ